MESFGHLGIFLKSTNMFFALVVGPISFLDIHL